MSEGVVLDALPYIDPEYGFDGMRDFVNKLIEEEMKTMPPKDYLKDKPLPEFKFGSTLLEEEYQRVKEGKPMRELDITRYSLGDPPQSRQNDVTAWVKAVENSNAQLMHQSNRLINLELLQKYGGNSWRLHNYQLEGALKHFEAVLEQQKSEITALNKKRKQDQMEAANNLSTLDRRLGQVFRDSLNVELACAQLEAEVEALAKVAQEKKHHQNNGNDHEEKEDKGDRNQMDQGE